MRNLVLSLSPLTFHTVSWVALCLCGCLHEEQQGKSLAGLLDSETWVNCVLLDKVLWSRHTA
jgi:hypothetical protein